MPISDMTTQERGLALEAITWALTAEGAQVDLDLALQLRGVMRKQPLDDAGWQRAWAIAARLVVGAAELVDQADADRLGVALAEFRRGMHARGWDRGTQRWLPMSQEPLVIAAQRELQAQAVARAG